MSDQQTYGGLTAAELVALAASAGCLRDVCEYAATLSAEGTTATLQEGNWRLKPGIAAFVDLAVQNSPQRGGRRLLERVATFLGMVSRWNISEQTAGVAIHLREELQKHMEGI